MLEKRVKPQLFRGNIVVKASPIHGYGVFAAQDFHTDDLIEECYSLLINENKADAPVDLDNFLFNADTFSSIPLGNGCIYNHMDKPNADYEFDTESALMTITANKYIREGEEIFISYGKNWFDLRKMKAHTTHALSGLSLYCQYSLYLSIRIGNRYDFCFDLATENYPLN